METMTLRAPAKLNLALDVVGLQENGYHLLDMIMQNVSIYDTLVLRSAPQGIALHCDAGAPQGEDNIAVKAALRLLQYAGVERGCEITLEKHIPSQAGMGGGSADAAAVLLGLNKLWQLNIPLEELEKIALPLGADVPFALRGGLARAQGIGEKLTSMPYDIPLHFVCAKGEGGLSTPAVYRQYDALPARPLLDMEGFCAALQQGNWQALAALGGNALAPAAYALNGGIEPLVEKLYETGAVYAQMTGSGAAVFGMYTDKAQAQAACETLRAMAGWAEYAVACPGVE